MRKSGRDRIVDIVLCDERIHYRQLSLTDHFEKHRFDLLRIVFGSFDPQAFPVIEKQGQGIVFQPVANAKFNEQPFSHADAVEDLEDDAVFVSLRIDFATEWNEELLILKTWTGFETVHIRRYI